MDYRSSLRVKEEMELTVDLEDRETCNDLMETVEKFEKASKEGKSSPDEVCISVE